MAFDDRTGSRPVTEGELPVREVRNAKPVSQVVGGGLVVIGGLGIWLAGVLSAGSGDGSSILFASFFAIFALIQGVRLLSWKRRSKPTALMRVQAADVLPGVLPLVVFASTILSVPRIADLDPPLWWMAGLVLAGATVSVVPEEKAVLLEIPALRRGRYLDWLRWQNFGAGTLGQSVLFAGMFFTSPRPPESVTPLIVVLAAAQAAVSVWRIVEHRQFAKAGVHLSGLQVSWLRVIHIRRGHEAAVRELRTMYPKIGPWHAETVIENLYRTREEPPDAT